MNESNRETVRRLVSDGDTYGMIAWIEHNYEFRCPSFVYAGPGHQSRHACDRRYPHPIEGEHGDDLYEWVGTSVNVLRNGSMKLVYNAEHHGDGRCGH